MLRVIFSFHFSILLCTISENGCLFNRCAALAELFNGAVGGASTGGFAPNTRRACGRSLLALSHSDACLLPLQAATTDEGETHFNQMGIDV